MENLQEFTKRISEQLAARKAESLTDQLENIYRSFYEAFPDNPMPEMTMPAPYVDEVYPDYLIVEAEGKYFQVNYTMDESGAVTFEDKSAWVEVTKEENWIPAKSSDEVVYFGKQIKAIKMDDGSVKLGGYLITYGDETKTDLTGDFFTPDTDFGNVEQSDAFFNHRLPVIYNDKAVEYKSKFSNPAELTRDDIGIFAEIVMGAHDEYERMIGELGLAGKLGWSSGTAGHLVDREPVGKAWKITKWPLGLDASLTPTPAEFRNTVVPLKSISDKTSVTVEPAVQVKHEAKQEPTIESVQSTGVKTMDITEEKLQELLTQASTDGAKKAIESVEAIKSTGGTVQVVTDEADRPFVNLAEQCKAVIDYTKSMGRVVHPRIKGLQALEAKAVQGASEGVPQDGGILLEPTISPTVMMPIHEEGPFSGAASRLPVGANSNSGWINGVDETSRATGSRWGGVRGYRLAEGDTLTKSKPKFKRIQWELKKYGCLVYDTNELIKDAGQFNAVVQQACREEISFMLNDDIMNGPGVSGAAGLMNSGALITVTRTTGSAVLGDDISNMWARMAMRSKSKSAWYINGPEVGPQLDKLFAVGSTAVLFPYAGYTSDGVRTLYGRPVVETEFNAALNTTGDILLADMSQYLLWEKGGVDYQTSMHVEFLTDQEVLRFIYRADGQTADSSALTPYKGTTTTSPFVVLGSAT